MDSKNGIDYGHNYDFILKWMAEVLRSSKKIICPNFISLASLSLVVYSSVIQW